jgi:uncharacterized membrane protein YcaP (DUF421 family)
MFNIEFFTQILIIIFKVSLVYWLVLAGLKLIGRRALGQIGPHEFILLAFLAKIMADKIITDETGIWGNIAGGITLMFYVWIIDRIPALRRYIQGDIIPLMKNSTIDEIALRRHHVTFDDLNHLARKQGYKTYEVFEEIYIEKNGHLSGILISKSNT